MGKSVEMQATNASLGGVNRPSASARRCMERLDVIPGSRVQSVPRKFVFAMIMRIEPSKAHLRRRLATRMKLLLLEVLLAYGQGISVTNPAQAVCSVTFLNLHRCSCSLYDGKHDQIKMWSVHVPGWVHRYRPPWPSRFRGMCAKASPS